MFRIDELRGPAETNQEAQIIFFFGIREFVSLFFFLGIQVFPEMGVG